VEGEESLQTGATRKHTVQYSIQKIERFVVQSRSPANSAIIYHYKRSSPKEFIKTIHSEKTKSIAKSFIITIQ